uniref:Uncharacterized protein n=1 Tax=Moschus moschiferus TaxID=68415 RepID=A0A8C6G1L0_MOSMO
MRFPRLEYWSGLSFPSPGGLLHPGIEFGSPALQADSLPSESLGKISILFSTVLKARTFDLEAMFEQTRRTAVERSRKTLVEPVFGRLSERWLSELCTPLIVDPDSIEN